LLDKYYLQCGKLRGRLQRRVAPDGRLGVEKRSLEVDGSAELLFHHGRVEGVVAVAELKGGAVDNLAHTAHRVCYMRN